MNLYEYAVSNPINYTDPYGLTSLFELIPYSIPVTGGFCELKPGYLPPPDVNVVPPPLFTPSQADSNGDGVADEQPVEDKNKTGNEAKEENLPTGGDKPFIPKKHKGKGKLKDKEGGYLDNSGNSWQWDPIKGEWDVQHKDGSHTNVGPDGNITHGPDNF